jgi:lipopolysaccharide export system permease protein
MLTIVDRYLLGEVLKALAAIVFVLMLIVASMLFLRTLEEVNLGALNADLVLRFLGLQLTRDAASLLPPAFFLAALATLIRLARDNELIALNACGIGPSRLYRNLLVLALPVAALTAWFALVLQPWAALGIVQIRVQQQEQATQIAGLQSGRFYVEEEGDVVVYIGSIAKTGGLEQVFILDRRGKVTRLVVSERGRHQEDDLTGDHLVTLTDGHRFDGNPGQGSYVIGRFVDYVIRISGAGTGGHTGSKSSTRTSSELLHSEDIKDRAELEHRVAAPLAIVSLALIAVPLVDISSRQRPSGRLALAFLAYLSFFNLQRLAESWLAGGVTPPWLSSFWYQALVLALVHVVLLPETPWWRSLRGRLGARWAALRSLPRAPASPSLD